MGSSVEDVARSEGSSSKLGRSHCSRCEEFWFQAVPSLPNSFCQGWCCFHVDDLYVTGKCAEVEGLLNQLQMKYRLKKSGPHGIGDSSSEGLQ